MVDRYGPTSPSEMPNYVQNSEITAFASTFAVWTEPVRIYANGFELTVHAVSHSGGEQVILDGFEDPLDTRLIKVTISTVDGESDNCRDPRDPRIPDSAPVLAVRSSSSTATETVGVFFFSPIPHHGEVSITFDHLGSKETVECAIRIRATDSATAPQPLEFHQR